MPRVVQEELIWINNLDEQLMTTSTDNDGVALVMRTFNFTVVDMMVVSHISQGGQFTFCPPPVSGISHSGHFILLSLSLTSLTVVTLFCSPCL